MRCCRATRPAARLCATPCARSRPSTARPIASGLLDRGIPSDEVLAEMRKGPLSKARRRCSIAEAVREGADVKLLLRDREMYVLAQSRARINRNAPCGDASSNGYGRVSGRSRR
jgi:hypothetical protein